MAVFTPVSRAEAGAFVDRYDLGGLRALTPIAEGVENTNYRIETGRGPFVLTLFERRTDEAGLPFCLGFTAHAAARGLPCATPVADREGGWIGRLNGRPASLLDWLPGVGRGEPSPSDMGRAGATLARLHLAGADFDRTRADPVGPEARRALFERCRTRAEGDHARMLERMAPWIDARASDPAAGLPSGPIHADWFPDNLLFEGDEVSGVIDFYLGCTGAWAYDLAIALSAWGLDADGAPRPGALDAFRSGYESVRPLSPAEHAALPALGAVAAIRFTLTRMNDLLFHDPAHWVTPKDPAAFYRRFEWWSRRIEAA